MARANNATSTRGRPFKEGNPGRRKGSRNKVTVAGILAARDAFAHLGPVVIARITAHYYIHKIPPESCATCRHYDTMVAEYVWGKPTQVHEFDVGELVERLQRERGLDAKAANVIAIRAGVLVEGAGAA